MVSRLCAPPLSSSVRRDNRCTYMGRGKHSGKWHRVAESILSKAFGGGWAAKLAYSVGLQGAIKTRLHELSLPGGAPQMPPLRVGFASDFHAGPLTHKKVLRKAFNALAAFSPEIVLLGGDFISFRAEYIDAFCAELRVLKPPLGMYAVMGNHDLRADDAFIVERLRAAGVRVLINESAQLAEPYERVFICGLDDPFTGSPDPVSTFHQAGGVRILLMHSPMGLRLLGGHRFELALAGHTHGGQIALPGGVPIVMSRGHGGRGYAHGQFRLPDGQGVLIVSRGVGTTGLPIRIFAPSEVHICTVSWGPEARDVTGVRRQRP